MFGNDCEQSKLAAILLLEDYFGFKLIDQKICALHMRMNGTCGLAVGVTQFHYEKMYLYQLREEAEEALGMYEDLSQPPTGPWLICRTHKPRKNLDEPNPLMKD